MSDTVTFKIKRQNTAESSPFWENFVLPYIPNSNVISCLMDIQTLISNVLSSVMHVEEACLADCCRTKEVIFLSVLGACFHTASAGHAFRQFIGNFLYAL